jgi:Do/DeqQ family serine protease
MNTKGNSILTAVLSGIAGASVVLAVLHYNGTFSDMEIVVLPDGNNGEKAPVRVVSLTDEHPETSIDFTHASGTTVNSVVSVISEYETSYHRNPLFEYFYGPQGGVAQSYGSGVILSEDGYIVTNNHVIQDASVIRVTLNDKRSFDAKVIGRDPSTDIALLKIPANGLTFVPLGNSDDVKVGEWVLAVGNPFNLTSTVTAGIVSAKARNINILQRDRNQQMMPIESFIQTDAAVNPGNSGGALVNARGELIGINTAIASKTGSYSGYSFAVPVNIMHKVTKDLMEFGEVKRAFMGVSITDINQEIAGKLNLSSMKGVLINSVVSGGAADDAGLKQGDVIQKIGTVPVENVAELQEQLSKFRPGDKINLEVQREDEVFVKTMILKDIEGSTDVKSSPKQSAFHDAASFETEFEEIGLHEMRMLNLRNGVKVKQLKSGKLRSAGIKEGFIITSINKKSVKTVQEVVSILKEHEGALLIEGIHSNGARGYYVIE